MACSHSTTTTGTNNLEVNTQKLLVIQPIDSTDSDSDCFIDISKENSGPSPKVDTPIDPMTWTVEMDQTLKGLAQRCEDGKTTFSDWMVDIHKLWLEEQPDQSQHSVLMLAVRLKLLKLKESLASLYTAVPVTSLDEGKIKLKDAFNNTPGYQKCLRRFINPKPELNSRLLYPESCDKEKNVKGQWTYLQQQELVLCLELFCRMHSSEYKYFYPSHRANVSRLTQYGRTKQDAFGLFRILFNTASKCALEKRWNRAINFEPFVLGFEDFVPKIVDSGPNRSRRKVIHAPLRDYSDVIFNSPACMAQFRHDTNAEQDSPTTSQETEHIVVQSVDDNLPVQNVANANNLVPLGTQHLETGDLMSQLDVFTTPLPTTETEHPEQAKQLNNERVEPEPSHNPVSTQQSPARKKKGRPKKDAADDQPYVFSRRPTRGRPRGSAARGRGQTKTSIDVINDNNTVPQVGASSTITTSTVIASDPISLNILEQNLSKSPVKRGRGRPLGSKTKKVTAKQRNDIDNYVTSSMDQQVGIPSVANTVLVGKPTSVANVARRRIPMSNSDLDDIYSCLLGYFSERMFKPHHCEVVGRRRCPCNSMWCQHADLDAQLCSMLLQPGAGVHDDSTHRAFSLFRMVHPEMTHLNTAGFLLRVKINNLRLIMMSHYGEAHSGYLLQCYAKPRDPNSVTQGDSFEWMRDTLYLRDFMLRDGTFLNGENNLRTVEQALSLLGNANYLPGGKMCKNFTKKNNSSVIPVKKKTASKKKYHKTAPTRSKAKPLKFSARLLQTLGCVGETVTPSNVDDSCIVHHGATDDGNSHNSITLESAARSRESTFCPTMKAQVVRKRSVSPTAQPVNQTVPTLLDKLLDDDLDFAAPPTKCTRKEPSPPSCIISDVRSISTETRYDSEDNEDELEGEGVIVISSDDDDFNGSNAFSQELIEPPQSQRLADNGLLETNETVAVDHSEVSTDVAHVLSDCNTEFAMVANDSPRVETECSGDDLIAKEAEVMDEDSINEEALCESPSTDVNCHDLEVASPLANENCNLPGQVESMEANDAELTEELLVRTCENGSEKFDPGKAFDEEYEQSKAVASNVVNEAMSHIDKEEEHVRTSMNDLDTTGDSDDLETFDTSTTETCDNASTFEGSPLKNACTGAVANFALQNVQSNAESVLMDHSYTSDNIADYSNHHLKSHQTYTEDDFFHVCDGMYRCPVPNCFAVVPARVFCMQHIWQYHCGFIVP